MKPAGVLLALVALMATAFAAEESCVDRCGTFNPQHKCQCDSMCVYYSSCCGDFDTACPKKVARGDVFDEVEDMTPVTTMSPEETTIVTTIAPMTSTTQTPTTTAPPSTTDHPTLPPDPDAIPCSGRPFDAFLQVKNGSIYAFRGNYFFELDERSVLPGYPKLIKDVWGISGPIDAAFTRINCQGKTYIFKGNRYWRFEDNVLDKDYPRDISVGFETIPDHVNAAFAIAAPGHHGREKVYFFKGDQYYQYEFKHQPSHAECVQMNRASPSVLFSRYTDLYCDQTWETLFTQLFGGSTQGHPRGPRLISKDWVGIRPPVDAAMVGRVYVSPQPDPSPPPTERPAPVRRMRPSRRKRPGRRSSKRGGRGRHSRSLSLFEDLFDYFTDYEYSDMPDYDTTTTQDHMGMSDYDTTTTTTQDHRGKPAQNVYFFKRDKYYRVDLKSKRVDNVYPPYPRSIAKYWLGCKREGTTGTDESRAEKK